MNYSIVNYTHPTDAKFNKIYWLYGGLYFTEGTNEKVMQIISDAFKSRTRLIFDYGDITTGKSCNETFDTTGYIGRSTGEIKVPLLVYNSRSYGGGALTSSIVKITTSKGKIVLYQHPNYSN